MSAIFGYYFSLIVIRKIYQVLKSRRKWIYLYYYTDICNYLLASIIFVINELRKVNIVLMTNLNQINKAKNKMQSMREFSHGISYFTTSIRLFLFFYSSYRKLSAWVGIHCLSTLDVTATVGGWTNISVRLFHHISPHLNLTKEGYLNTIKNV